MKINYIARINPFAEGANGGGEHVMRALIGYGKKIHDISIITPDTVMDYDDDADLNIFADVFNFPLAPGFMPEDMDIWRKKPYVHFSNAYVDICVHDYFQCDNADPVCNCYGTDLMLGAALRYFVSPLHLETVGKKVPGILTRKNAILRPIVDTDKFKNYKLDPRPIDYLYVAPLLEPKGFFNALDYLAEQNADPRSCLFVGANPHRFDLGAMRHRQRVPYSEMAKLFNEAKVFVHLPAWKEPMGRTVIEAALCGCNLALNENVGATSFGFEDIRDPNNYEGATEEFWEKIEGLVTYLNIDDSLGC